MMDKKGLISFYKEQLNKFMLMQSRGQHITDFGVRVTPILFEATERRLKELQGRINIGNITYMPILKNGVRNGR